MDVAAARALFDRELRASAADTCATTVEKTARSVRELSRDSTGWAGVMWSDLDAATADEEIDAQLAHFAQLGRTFEWKLYDGDQPTDLSDRLQRRGFTAGEPEALMIAAIEDLDVSLLPPTGVEIVEVRDGAGIDDLCRVAEEVFGHDTARMGDALRRQLEVDPSSLSVVLAVVAGQPISSARTEFHTSTRFASLWGGGTLPAWRRRGVYRSMVAYRAREARARGFRYLRVDASPESEPILLRLGFVRAGTTTPYDSPRPDPAIDGTEDAAG